MTELMEKRCIRCRVVGPGAIGSHIAYSLRRATDEKVRIEMGKKIIEFRANVAIEGIRKALDQKSSNR